MKFVLAVVGLLFCLPLWAADLSPSEMVRVGGGILRPFYPPSPKEESIPVETFLLDKNPVTNAQFLSFILKKTQWRRDRIKKLFADGRYLSHWEGAQKLGAKAEPQQPVTNVSWYAAKAYCVERGARLPTENEWEYAARASEKEADAVKDMEWRKRVLDWYALPSPPKLPKVRQGTANYWGVHDMHGLIWEWVLDFNSSLVSSDNRENAEGTDKSRFCGAGAMVATEKEDYASFMRIAFRSSLKAHYTASTLGFRCAMDAEAR